MEETVLRLGALGAAEASGFVGAQDEVAEVAFLLGEGLGFLLLGEAASDVEVGLAFVATEVQDFEAAEILLRNLLVPRRL
jgi:hypothetical protein